METRNSISETEPRLIKYFGNVEDSKKYTKYSHVKISMKCPDCGFIKIMPIQRLTEKGFGCINCGDGKSHPEKLMHSLLTQLNIVFKSEYSPNWIKPKRYDFYFEVKTGKYIVEMDGWFHFQDNNRSGQTAKATKEIDSYKDKLALEHNIEVIRIDCKKVNLEYIKNNILNSNLNKLFDLSEIDWFKCEEFACSSFVKIACELWNSGLNSSQLVSRNLGMHVATIIKYLKQGTKLGWCNYSPQKQKELNTKSQSISVICINTGEVFNSIKEASIKTNINKSSISACCHKKIKSAGKDLITKEKVIWEYF